jgi:hypothetical protein
MAESTKSSSKLHPFICFGVAAQLGANRNNMTLAIGKLVF